MKNKEGVKVHRYDKEKDNITNCNHELCLFIEDVSDEYQTDLDDYVYNTCICLECGLYADFKISKEALNCIIDTNKDSLSAIMSYYVVRNEYLKLKSRNLSEDEIKDELNKIYQNNDYGRKKVKKY
jgi:hypothetical protein